jgi:hypothetical protein
MVDYLEIFQPREVEIRYLASPFEVKALAKDILVLKPASILQTLPQIIVPTLDDEHLILWIEIVPFFPQG